MNERDEKSIEMMQAIIDGIEKFNEIGEKANERHDRNFGLIGSDERLTHYCETCEEK